MNAANSRLIGGGGVDGVIQYLPSHTYPKKVIFVCFDGDSLSIYRNKLMEL